MTADEFKAIRKGARLSVNELATLLRMNGDRLIRRWEDGEQDVSGPVSILLELLRDGVWPVK